MMCKRIAALLLLLIGMSAWSPGAYAAENHYVVIYDDPASETVQRLREYTLYSSWNCAYLSLWDVEELSGYDAALLCVGEAQQLPDALTRSLRQLPVFVIGSGGLEQLSGQAAWRQGNVMIRCEGESGNESDILLNAEGIWMLDGEEGASLGGEVYVGDVAYPLCRRVGNITHFAYFDASEPILCAQLTKSLQLWQWPYDNAPTAYGQYLVLDYVYPFLDPAALLERTDMLEEEGVPYLLAITPIFSNGEYPAMKRFCECLRYLQSRGAGLILRVPFVSIDQVELEELMHSMEIAYEAYATYGVYPLAVEAPVAWMHCEKGLDALRGYRTVFLFESDDAQNGRTLTQNIAYQDGHQIVAPAWQDSQAFSTAYAQAIYLDAQMDVEEMREMVQRIKTSRRVLKRLSDTENVVYSGKYAVVGLHGIVKVNGKQMDTSYIPFTYDEDYVYDRGFGQLFRKQIETSNQWLMAFVGLSCTIFLVMIVLFRRQIRRELILGRRTRDSQKNEEVKL